MVYRDGKRVTPCLSSFRQCPETSTEHRITTHWRKPPLKPRDRLSLHQRSAHVMMQNFEEKHPSTRMGGLRAQPNGAAVIC
jgi:hypothetical protein